ncbi:P-loop containing nucleoside triphosphate hydrolase protein [Backusella circina FSU 941]|nr:P-loop containing nucleoside triphosphate hydrolase protein [Backusella circina FSU 941]
MSIILFSVVLVAALHVSAFIREKFDELFYVHIIVTENELIFTPINEYSTNQYKNIHQLKRAEGITGYLRPPYISQDMNSLYERVHHDLCGSPSINLIPLHSSVFDIRYKGYKIHITRSENTSSTLSRFGNASRPTVQTITLKIRSQNILRLQSFMQEWINEYYNVRQNKLIIYKYNDQEQGEYWKEYGDKYKRPFHSLVLQKGKQEQILKDIMTFRESKEWYIERGIPFRRGILLHGLPGTGNTSLIQSLASEMNMNIAVVNLSTVPNDDTLFTLLFRVPKDSIIVIKDIDVFNFKEMTTAVKLGASKVVEPQASLITLSGLLYAIDSISDVEESIIFMTCSDIYNVPPALTRPGKVNIISNLSYADDYQIELLFWRFFCPEVNKTPLEDIPKEVFPLYANTATDLLYSIRKYAMDNSGYMDIQIEISPAELINFSLKHAIKFNLPKHPEMVEKCFESLQDGVTEFIQSIVYLRKQGTQYIKKMNNDSKETVASKEGYNEYDDESSEEL